MKFGSSRDSSDRIGNSLTRGVLQSADDTQLLQEVTLNGFADEAMTTIENAHPYGFMSHPKKPSMVGGIMRYAVAFLSFLNGNRSHGVAFSVGDRRYRLYKTQEGEVALHDDQGQWIYLQRSGILLKAPNANTVTLQVDQASENSGAAQTMGQDASQIPQGATTVVLTGSSLSDAVGQGTRNITAQGNVTITSTGAKVYIETQVDDIIVNPSGKKVWLGGDPQKDIFALVETVGGPALNVYARIG